MGRQWTEGLSSLAGARCSRSNGSRLRKVPAELGTRVEILNHHVEVTVLRVTELPAPLGVVRVSWMKSPFPTPVWSTANGVCPQQDSELRSVPGTHGKQRSIFIVKIPLPVFQVPEVCPLLHKQEPHGWGWRSARGRPAKGGRKATAPTLSLCPPRLPGEPYPALGTAPGRAPTTLSTSPVSERGGRASENLRPHC